MSEQFPEQAGDLDAGNGGEDRGLAAAEPTGNPRVDAVVASLEQLEGAPVADHVAVFEKAHEELRAALADAGNETGSAPQPGEHAGAQRPYQGPRPGQLPAPGNQPYPRPHPGAPTGS